KVDTGEAGPRLTYFGLKGLAFTLVSTTMLPYFQLMGVSGTHFQLAQVVASIPWSMKGWIGVLSDVFPLGRFHKRGYLQLSALVGIAGIAGLALLPLKTLDPSNVWYVALLFCASNVFFATFDLLCEGKYSEIIREEGGGSEVLTMVWFSLQLGALVAALLVGLLVDAHGPQPMLLPCLPLALLALWRTYKGDLPEEKARSWKSLRLKLYSEPELFQLAGVMALGSLGLAMSAVFLGRTGRGIFAFATSGSLVWYSFKTLPRTLAKCNLYMFLISVSYMDLSGPLAYFYTGGPGCVPDGPHFSYSYYLAVSNVVGAAGSAIGAVLFQTIQTWSFQGAFCITTFVQVLASGFDLLMISRQNLALGFSDELTYLFGDAACQSIASQMATMPMALLTARLCPRGAEATVFAILAGFQNFGSAVGSVLGVELAEGFGIEASKDGPCNFEWLSTLVVFCHVVMPISCLSLTFCLVPAARIDDEAAFEDEGPPPSFASPAASPSNSPEATPDDFSPPGDLPDMQDYCLMQDDGFGMNRAFSGSQSGGAL
ncbi:unnamed protein product, partial [Polarella glacialis]